MASMSVTPTAMDWELPGIPSTDSYKASNYSLSNKLHDVGIVC